MEEVLYNLKVGKDFPIQPKSRVHEKKFTTGKFKTFSRQRKESEMTNDKRRGKGQILIRCDDLQVIIFNEDALYLGCPLLDTVK